MTKPIDAIQSAMELSPASAIMTSYAIAEAVEKAITDEMTRSAANPSADHVYAAGIYLGIVRLKDKYPDLVAAFQQMVAPEIAELINDS